MKLRLIAAAALVTFMLTTSLAYGASWFNNPNVIYSKGQDTWVKVKRGNKKLVPFDHPQKLSPEEVERVLLSLTYSRPGLLSIGGKEPKRLALFTEEEARLLAGHVSTALLQAGSSEWVDFSLNNFRGQILIGSFRQSDGVIFVKDGKLNVALRNIAEKTSPDESLNTYDPTKGYRAFVKLAAAEGQQQVADNWVAVDRDKISALKPALESLKPEAASLSDLAPAPETDEQKPPETQPAPTESAAPQQAAPAPASEKASVKQRLLELQELYDEGLITKEEYDLKRAEILEDL